MRAIVAMIAISAFACQKTGKEAPTAQSANTAAPIAASAPGMPQMRVGSAAFHLEIAGVYERFQDMKTAGDHFSQALQSAENPMQRVQAYSGLGRVKDAGGDKDVAIDSLEQALAEMDKLKASGPLQMPAFSMPVGDDVTGRLARLYVEKGRFEKAERIYEGQLAAASDPWQRERIYPLEVDLYRKAGTLDKKITEKEKALEQSPEDESALRFLAATFGGGGILAPALPGGAPGQQQVEVTKQVRVYERLYRLHPDEMQVRQTLQALFERTGRIDEAVKLAAIPATVGRTECIGGQALLATSPTLNAAAEAVRIRVRARQDDEALAETAKLAAINAREGIAATLLAAQLYLDQGKADRADQLIKQAAQRARTREEQQQVAFAREQELARAGHAAELKMLYGEWQKSEDPCLRLAATQRGQMAKAAAPAMPQPPAPPRP